MQEVFMIPSRKIFPLCFITHLLLLHATHKKTFCPSPLTQKAQPFAGERAAHDRLCAECRNYAA